MANDELERVKKQLADVMGEGGSYRNLQVQLDAALQKHKDDAAAHTAAEAKIIETAKGELAKQAEMNNLLSKRVNDLLDANRKLQEEHLTTLQTVAEKANADVQAAQDRAAFQVQQYQLAHAEALAILQESPEARLLRTQQAQEAAELKARQDAARAALASKLK